MTDLLRVHILDAFDDLGKKLPSISLIKIAVVLQSLKKLSSLTNAVSFNDYSCTR